MTTEYNFGDSFQRKLLKLYFTEPQSVFNIVEPSYFSNPIYADVCRISKELYSKHNKKELSLSKTTLLTIVRSYLGKRKQDLWRPYRKAIRSIYKEELQDKTVIKEQAFLFAKEKKFRSALIESEKDINNHNFGKAISRFNSLKNFGVDRDLGIEYWKDIDNPGRWKEDREGIIGTFYLKKLDATMQGGLGAGELAIFMASAKKGKTSFLARFAAGALWQRKTVAIATAELSAKKYRKRIDSMITRIPSWKLTKYATDEDNALTRSAVKKARRRLKRVYRKLALAQKQMKGRLFIKQWPTNKGKVQDIEAWLEQLEEQGVKVDILFVDYIRVFKPNEGSEDQKSRIGQVTLDLRGLAVERNIPVWTATQTNRAALNKERIGPEDLAEDISQFFTLDFLVAFCQSERERDRALNKRGKVVRPEHGRLFLTAARDVGRGGVIPVSIDRDTLNIKERSMEKRK